MSNSLCFKFVLVGDSAVGKTSISNMFCINTFDKNQPQTIGLDFGVKNITIETQSIKIQVWDTAGQEKYHSITKAYFRGSAAVFLVFDVTNRESFSHISTWTNDATCLSPPTAVKVLIGNKTDLEANRAVTSAEASDYAEQNGLLYFETSALSGERINDSFIETAHKIYEKYKNDNAKFNINVNDGGNINDDSDIIDIYEVNQNQNKNNCC